jgi:hypothetical protein
MLDDKGRRVKAAPPALPVEVLGIGGVPMAGDTLTVVENEARAREVAAYRQEKATAKRTTTAPSSIENMFSALAAKNTVIEYPLVVKADVQGSTEAIVNALNRISTDEIKVRILNSGVGAITESDVMLAQASGAPIVGFNVRPNAKARELIERNKVRLKYHDVIYQLTDDIRSEMAGELGPERIETVVGRAEIKEVFPAGKKDKAAGLLVLEGYIRKGINARLTRNDVIVSKTVIASLRRFKDDVPKCARGWNAAWCCRTPTTSSRATCSKCSRWKSANARSDPYPIDTQNAGAAEGAAPAFCLGDRLRARGFKAHPVATSAACGDASLLLPLAGGAGVGHAPRSIPPTKGDDVALPERSSLRAWRSNQSGLRVTLDCFVDCFSSQ